MKSIQEIFEATTNKYISSILTDHMSGDGDYVVYICNKPFISPDNTSTYPTEYAALKAVCEALAKYFSVHCGEYPIIDGLPKYTYTWGLSEAVNWYHDGRIKIDLL